MPQFRQLSSLSLGLLERLSPSLWNHNCVRIHGGKVVPASGDDSGPEGATTLTVSVEAPPRVTSPLLVMPFQSVASPAMAISSADSSPKFTLPLRMVDPTTAQEFEAPKTLATPLMLMH